MICEGICSRSMESLLVRAENQSLCEPSENVGAIPVFVAELRRRIGSSATWGGAVKGGLCVKAPRELDVP